MNKPTINSHYTHVKTGKTYTVIAVGLLESTVTPVVIYQDKLTTWVRPLEEFMDGRFILAEEQDEVLTWYRSVQSYLSKNNISLSKLFKTRFADSYNSCKSNYYNSRNKHRYPNNKVVNGLADITGYRANTELEKFPKDRVREISRAQNRLRYRLIAEQNDKEKASKSY